MNTFLKADNDVHIAFSKYSKTFFPDGLVRQVQIACDTAKLGVARLTGTVDSAPKHEDTEKTLEELLARIAAVRAYLSGFSEADFADAASRRITQPRWEGKYLSGQEFMIRSVLPNFYFHVTTAYAILRHNGIELGKKDFLGDLPLKTP